MMYLKLKTAETFYFFVLQFVNIHIRGVTKNCSQLTGSLLELKE